PARTGMSPRRCTCCPTAPRRPCRSGAPDRIVPSVARLLPTAVVGRVGVEDGLLRLPELGTFLCAARSGPLGELLGSAFVESALHDLVDERVDADAALLGVLLKTIGCGRVSPVRNLLDFHDAII